MELLSGLSGVEPGLARLFNCEDSLIVNVMAFQITAARGRAFARANYNDLIFDRGPELTL
jgi:hypothetical protein